MDIREALLTEKDETRFWTKVQKVGSDDCWKWMAGCTKWGYGKFKLNGKTIQAHRVAYEIQNGPIPDGMDVLHSCDNRACQNGRHLFPGTDLDNTHDMINKGRAIVPPIFTGESNYNSRFTETEILVIRSEWYDGVGTRTLASKNHTTRKHIQDIVHGKRWSHIKGGRNEKKMPNLCL